MRAIFLLLILAGVGLAALYPWYNNNFSGEEIGIWPVFEEGSFKSVEISLSPSQDPLRVLVDLTTKTPVTFDRAVAVLTLTADVGSRTVLADTMSFGNAKAREQSPQMQSRIYRGEAGVISPVENAVYRFTLAQGDAEGVDFSKVDLILRSGAAQTDPRAQPVGFALIAIGLIGLVLASRFRGRRQENPNSQPPPPRWGRGGGER